MLKITRIAFFVVAKLLRVGSSPCRRNKEWVLEQRRLSATDGNWKGLLFSIVRLVSFLKFKSSGVCQS